MTGPLILKDNPAEDLEAATKQYVDNHTSDVVLYTSQTLTDDQKTQARGNIGAAPAGFGLGQVNPNEAENNDANTITKTGWYMASVNTPIPGWWIIYSATYGDTMYQFAYANEGVSGMLMGTVLQRSKKTVNVDWTPWEYINPPMKLGVEYRTTERYLGKPVYIKTVDTGALPNTTYKIVAATFPNANRIIDYGGAAYRDSSHFIHLPCIRYGHDYYGTDSGVQVVIDNNSGISISTNKDFSMFTDSSVWVKYTKSTD